MRKHAASSLVAAWALALSACSKVPTHTGQNAPDSSEASASTAPKQVETGRQEVPSGSKPTANPDVPNPLAEPKAEPQPEPPPPTPADLEARAEADAQRRARAGKLFGKVIDPLTKASEAYTEHKNLDESTWFGKDRQDNLEKINHLLDDAVQVLGISEVETTRQTIRDLERSSAELIEQMVKDREARLAAPSREELNRVQKTYKTSREDLDERIAQSEATLKSNREQVLQLQLSFVRQMRGIGVELDLEAAQSLLSTVTGDDFVKMCVVFDNVRGVTIQLQELTEQSGESLEAAKRYYGSYVVLIRLLDHVQRDFVRRAREEMIPKLDEFAAKAGELILEANRNIEQGGDVNIGRQNIRSNELTIHATQLYTQYLREQASEIEERNAQLQTSLRDAENTYETVALSSEVATLLKEGSRNFAALLRLDLPALRGFQNEELKAEFQRLTEKMGRIN